MSGANLSKTTQTTNDYPYERWSILKPGGILDFESPHPEYAGDAQEGGCSVIEERFNTLDRMVLQYGRWLDGGKTFIGAQHRRDLGAGTIWF